MFSRTRMAAAAALQRVSPTSLAAEHSRRKGLGPSTWRYFCSTKDSSRSKSEKTGAGDDSSAASERSPPRKVVRRKQKETNSPKRNRKREWDQEHGPPKAFPVVQPSIYYYSTPSKGKAIVGSKAASRLVLPVMNASALLDPLKYCKTSSRLSFNRSGVNRSISGSDAARRLLRGKKDFILAARSLKSQPCLLEGHGVPPQLFQHCIDMADVLLLQYSPDIVECTFHNYNYAQGQSKLPNIVRLRG